METKEKTIRKVYVFRGRILTVRNDDALMPNGDVRGREVVEHPGGVCVLPIQDDGSVLLVEQFRYPYMEDVLEAPAGKLEPGEDPFEAAKRELREETGMVATEWFDLGWDYPSPGRATPTRSSGCTPPGACPTSDRSSTTTNSST